MKITNEDLFNVMVEKEWSVVFYGFRKFMQLYETGQELGCLPEQPTEENVRLAHNKFEELMEALGYA